MWQEEGFDNFKKEINREDSAVWKLFPNSLQGLTWNITENDRRHRIKKPQEGLSWASLEAWFRDAGVLDGETLQFGNNSIEHNRLSIHHGLDSEQG